jgi:hypothetical protein
MNALIPSLLTLAFLFCPIAMVFFVIRLVASLFSKEVSERIQKHPVAHFVWGCFAFVGFLVVMGFLHPAMWPPPSVERQKQRQKVLERVQKAGGWDVVRGGCEALVSNYPNGLSWFPPCSNVWVYSNHQTPYVTNLDYGPIPPAVAVLQAQEIRYYPPGFSRDELPVPVVRVKIFGIHSTGGHSIPYYGLEVVCSTNAESYLPQPAHGGVAGNHYDSYKQVADGVFEVY